MWQGFVDAYTRGDLTLPEIDNLVAISGLAKRIGSGADYCAGLGGQDLIS